MTLTKSVSVSVLAVLLGPSLEAVAGAGETRHASAVKAGSAEPDGSPGNPRVTIETVEPGRLIRIDGQPFATYRDGDDHMPVVWPIVGPSGHAMTRSYPLGPKLPLEATDHKHHASFWFAHQGVSGCDFWHRPGFDNPRAPNPGHRIVHREYARETHGGGDKRALLENRNDWMSADGERVLADRRNLVFGVLDAPPGGAAAPRMIDLTIDLIAADGPATLEDYKDGAFAVRVAAAMKVDANRGGAILNDRGRSDDAWGMPANWVRYSGPLTPDEDAPTGGVVLMSHPDAFRGACRWHVRKYGLFAANPFGEGDFPPADVAQGPVTIAEGKQLRLRYRAVFYAGDASPALVGQWYAAFAQTPLDKYVATTTGAATP